MGMGGFIDNVSGITLLSWRKKIQKKKGSVRDSPGEFKGKVEFGGREDETDELCTSAKSSSKAVQNITGWIRLGARTVPHSQVEDRFSPGPCDCQWLFLWSVENGRN